MTYEEYKNTKKDKKNNKWFKVIISKIFTLIIFTMLVIIISNYSESFRNFITNDVLNNSIDFSRVNIIMSKITNIFNNDTMNVSKQNNLSSEKYLDGIKYYIYDNENIVINDSGIVTFIGNKDGYNNTIIIQQSNGYYAWYGNIKESVKLYDYVESGSVIGTASKEYYYVLYKDDKPITYEN